jgi:CRP-like cAMP-binding protein
VEGVGIVIPAQAWAAFFFGALSAFSCVVGAAIGVAWRPPQRALAAILAFGAGALLAALAFELVLPAQEHAGFVPVAVGAIAGGISFVVLNELLNGRGGFLRHPSTTASFVRQRKREEAEALLAKLSRVSVCRALPPEDLQALVPHVEAVPVARGTHIYDEGEESDAFYLIDDGEVDVIASGRPSGAGAATIARLGHGDAFGEVSLLTGQRHAATAVAATDGTVWRIPKDDFYCLLAVSPTLAGAVADLLARDLALNADREARVEEAERWRKVASRFIEAHAVAPTPTDVRAVAKEHAGGAPLGIFLGLLLDGIPESLVIGMSMIDRPTVSAALLAGLFLSNLPEALSSAVGMKAQGAGTARILGMWTFLMLFIGVGAFAGNILFAGAPAWAVAAFEGAAAGAMLTMIAQTALPEAYEQGGWLSGIATLLGFLAAFFVRTLGEGH